METVTSLPADLKVSISGVRGHAPEVLTPAIAYRLVQSYASLIPAGAVVVSWDSRPSGDLLRPAVLEALHDAGREILVAGLVPLPTTQIAIIESGAAGGIDITASHNPAEYNGLKFLTNKGTFPNQAFVDQLAAGFLNTPAYEQHEKEITTTDIHEQAKEWHLAAVLKKAQPGRLLTIAIDAVNGAGSHIVPELLRRLDCDVIELANDPAQPFPHHPEPRPQHLAWTTQALAGKTFDICLYTDPDADRLAALDETGQPFSEEALLPLMVTSLAQSGATGTVVINQMTSQMTEVVASEFDGINVQRSKVGEANVIALMEETGAFFGGEGSGGLVDPTVHHGRDSLIGVVHLINLLRATDKTISQLVAELPSFVLHKTKYPAPAGSLDKLYDALETWAKKAHPEAEVDRRDGIRLAWNHTWLQIRPSNTEPIVRLFVEAPTEEAVASILGPVSTICEDLA